MLRYLLAAVLLVFLLFHRSLQQAVFHGKDRLSKGLGAADLLWLAMYYLPLSLVGLCMSPDVAGALRRWRPRTEPPHFTRLAANERQDGREGEDVAERRRRRTSSSFLLRILFPAVRDAWAERRKFWGVVISRADLACAGLLIVANVVWVASHVSATYEKYGYPDPTAAKWTVNAEILSRGLHEEPRNRDGARVELRAAAALPYVSSGSPGRKAGRNPPGGWPGDAIWYGGRVGLSLAGWASVLFASCHATLFIAVYLSKSKLASHLLVPSSGKRALLNLFGFLEWMSLLGIFFTSRASVRRTRWSLFVAGTRYSFAAFGIVHDGAVVRYLFVPLLIRYISNFAGCLRADFFATHTVAVFANPTTTLTRVTILSPSRWMPRHHPGAWISVRVPAADNSTHPFSIVTYHPRVPDAISVYARCRPGRGWCARLWEQVARRAQGAAAVGREGDDERPSRPCSVDGGRTHAAGSDPVVMDVALSVIHFSPGAPDDVGATYLDYDVVLLAAGGTGLSAVLPIMEHVVDERKSRVSVVWMVRDVEEVAAFAPHLCAAFDNPSCTRLCSLSVYLTRSSRGPSSKNELFERLEAALAAGEAWGIPPAVESEDASASPLVPSGRRESDQYADLHLKVAFWFTLMGHALGVSGFCLGRALSAAVAKPGGQGFGWLEGCPPKHASVEWTASLYLKCFFSANVLPVVFGFAGVGGAYVIVTAAARSGPESGAAGEKRTRRPWDAWRRGARGRARADYDEGDAHEWYALDDVQVRDGEKFAPEAESPPFLPPARAGRSSGAEEPDRSASAARRASTSSSARGPSSPESPSPGAARRARNSPVLANLSVVCVGRPNYAAVPDAALEREARRRRPDGDAPAEGPFDVACHAAGPTGFVDELRAACAAYRRDMRRSPAAAAAAPRVGRLDFFRSHGSSRQTAS